MPSVGSKQKIFTYNTALLIQKAYELGYQLSYGDAYRDPRLHGEFGTKVAYGARYSVHKLRLAVDFNLYKNGKYLTKSEDYTPLGEYWESLHPENRWGGRWNDGNHFSMKHGRYA